MSATLDHTFEVSAGPFGSTAYADDADQAFCAVVTLLQDQGMQGGWATVRELATERVVWRGTKPYHVTQRRQR
jgi:hypothetical protein